MNKTTRLANYFIWINIPIILACGLIRGNINEHESDELFIVYSVQEILSLCIYLFTVGMIYHMVRNLKLSNILTIIHLIFTFLGVIAVYLFWWGSENYDELKTDKIIYQLLLIFYNFSTMIILISIFIQSLFLINIVRALILKYRR